MIPRWITLGLAGAILLGVGAGYERRLQEAKQAARWVTEGLSPQWRLAS
jgi:hypothetical protein